MSIGYLGNKIANWPTTYSSKYKYKVVIAYNFDNYKV